VSFIVTEENLRACLKVEGHTCCSGFGFATQPSPGEFSSADTILPSISKDRLRKGIVSFLILDNPFTRRSRTVENGKQLAIYIRDWRLPIIWPNTQAVAAATQRLHFPLHSMLVLEMSKIMYEVNNLALATIVPS